MAMDICKRTLASKQLITVVSAFGHQGSSVVSALCSSPYSLRLTTRDPSSLPAHVTLHSDHEIVATEHTPPSFLTAFQDAYGVFAYTNFWAHRSMATEVRQGQMMADAALARGVKHLIWSSAHDVKKFSGGKLDKCYMFDGKASVERYIGQMPMKSTFLLPGVFMQSYYKMIDLDTGVLALPFPAETIVPMIDVVSDTGKFVKEILLRGITGRVHVTCGYYTHVKIMQEFAEVFGKGTFLQTSEEEYKERLRCEGESGDWLEAKTQIMRLMKDYGCYGGAEVSGDVGIVKGLVTWKEFLRRKKQQRNRE